MIDFDLDKPISETGQDKFDRSAFVEQVVGSLFDRRTKQTTGAVIGLCGEWGSGKSSILNLVQKHVELEVKEGLVVRFDPWLFSNKEDLISNFMADLAIAIRESGKLDEKSSVKIRRLISKYDSLISAGLESVSFFTQIPGIGKILHAIVGLFKAPSKTLHQTKLDLSKALLKAKLPIVVLIDEVDRLEDPDVLEIMRLVKAVADFPNISYLVAYDVDRVIEALNSGHCSPSTPNGQAGLVA
jgi:predicted KAP-like P-loop ATPase